jgi:hypothetical protein
MEKHGKERKDMDIHVKERNGKEREGKTRQLKTI